MKFRTSVNDIHVYRLHTNNVYEVCACDYVNMCGTADSLVLTKFGSVHNNNNNNNNNNLPPWIRSIDLFRHRRIAIVS